MVPISSGSPTSPTSPWSAASFTSRWCSTPGRAGSWAGRSAAPWTPRFAVAALEAAIGSRQPSEGCVHHSHRGSQYASTAYRRLLAENGLVGSMSRRGNPYDNAQAESLIKTLKVEAVY